jgi:cholestenol Delta-isomerase
LPRGYHVLLLHQLPRKTPDDSYVRKRKLLTPRVVVWKEYSLSDSRYLTGDTFVVCMETITAVFWGPLSILCASTIVSESPWRHPLQIVISLGQLYGDVLYYATCTFEEHARATLYSRPERYYFWGYYVLLNAFWIVIPSILLWQSLRSVAAVFARVQKLDQGKKGR